MRNRIIVFINICFLLINCKEIPYSPSQKLLTLADSLSKSTYEIDGKVFKNNIINNKEYNAIVKIASVKDLVYLTDYREPKIRCYAFKGLEIKRYSNIKPILFKHVSDTSLVLTDLGEITVIHFMYEHMFGIGNKGLNNEEHNKILSVILAERKARFAKNKSSR